ncbi:hypothetical protein MVEN_01494500 [Mycena venus]|uniref:NCA2-domain-containing protein n=1 Tax=Mycena venus TaxID=2733690 RepID=A0A8H6XUE9_9AGAR|nr:hypothetical protein MVEN_01494500 [Mycena venus]
MSVDVMARLRVDSSHFADNFTRPLSLTRLPTSSIASDTPPVVSESTETLKSLLGSLKPPVSQSSVDEALEYLARAARADSFAREQNVQHQENALKSAVISQVAVGLYARSLDIYLNEALEIEGEAEWWANVERSGVSVAWFLLQTLPSRIARVLRTILDALRTHRLPVTLSAFTPSALLRLLPPTALQPSAMTSSFFPHLEHEPTLMSLRLTRSSLRPAQFLQSIWSAIFLPLDLAREECRHKRRKLEKLRDERAEQLGHLAQLRLATTSGEAFPTRLVACISGEPLLPQDNAEHVQRISFSLLPDHIAEHSLSVQQFRRPSRMTLLWPKLLLLPPLTLYVLRSLYASRASIMEMARETKETVEGFIKNSLVDPLKEVLKTVRTGGEDGVIVRKEGVAADLDSLERMTLSLARDQLHYNSEQLAALSKQIRVGDLTPVLQLYEEDIKKPVKSALTGTLLRSMFIQVQKAKVDIDQALAGIDKLLKSQELTFAFVGLAPALVIVTVLGNYISHLWRGAQGEGRFGGRLKHRTMAWAAMRRIERLLVSQPRVGGPTSNSLTPLTTGLLLISITRLRTFAETSLPDGSRLREGFLEDVGDLEDPAMPREEKLRVVERMWRSWGGVLGWHYIAAERVFRIFAGPGSKIYGSLFLVLASANLGQANTIDSCLSPKDGCNATTPVACQATRYPNQTFLSSANSELPDGTYIAASLAGARQLLAYLDAHPTANVTKLLISDSTIEDLATDFGYGETDYDFLEWDWKNNRLAEGQVDYAPLNRNISQTLKQNILELDAISSRIMDRVAPSLESLAYLNYIRIWGEYGRVDVPDNRTRTVLDRDFPRLTHLTLRDTQWRFDDLPGRRAFFRPLPSLTHLHVVSSRYPAMEMPLAVVRQSVPNATHIRFSGNFPKEFAVTPMFLVQWTRSLLDGLFRSANSPLIIVQPDFSPMMQRGMECGNPGIQYGCLLSRLARNSDLHLSLPPTEDINEYGVTYESSRLFPFSRAIVEFEDRLHGGEGEWNIPSKNDTVEYATASLKYCSSY